MKRGCECFMPCVKDGWIDGSSWFVKSYQNTCEAKKIIVYTLQSAGWRKLAVLV